MNKGGLCGRFGRGAQALAEAMLTHGLVGCIASDAHRPDVRTPELSSAWDNLAEHFSERLSEQLAHAQSRMDPAQRTAACRPLPAASSEAMREVFL